MKVCRIAVLTFVMSMLLSAFFADWSSSASRKLLVVSWSDIHYGNEAYSSTAVDDAFQAGVALRPDVIVMAGDQVDNKCSKHEFLKRQDAFLTELGKRLDRVSASVVLALGNNDLYSNYLTDPEVLKVTAAAYAKRLRKYDYLDDLGNGVHPGTVAGMTWISVNSQIFSPLNTYAGRASQAERTFRWLETTLASLPDGRPVVLLMHIPPAYDLYDGKSSWRCEDLQRFGSVLGRCRGPIVLLAAHYHRNEVHAFQVPERGPVPLLVSGSLSFKYGNHPNWRSMAWTFGPGGKVERFDWVDRYPGNGSWDAVWQLVQPYAPLTYAAFVASLRDDQREYLRYMEDLEAHNDSWRSLAQEPKTRALLLDYVCPDDISRRHGHCIAPGGCNARR